MTTAQVEKQLNELRKLPENKECLNCLSVSKIGHGNVCVPFKTFVCSDCKSAHQAYSHRIKSLTMSIWTQDDVEQLKPKNGGSNKNAEAKYFARYDEQRLPRPRKGDDHTVWKDFVQQVYNEKRFYDDQGGDSDHTPSRASHHSPPRRSDRDDDRYRNDDDDYRPSHKTSRHSSRDQKDTGDRKYPSNDRHMEDGSDRKQYDFDDNNMYGSRSSGRDGSRHETSTYGGSRARDNEDDGEVRSRRKDVSKARGRAGRESERPRREAAPSAPKQQSHVQDLLGGFDGEPEATLVDSMNVLTVGGPDDADGWADFHSGGQTTQLGAEPAVTRSDMFSTQAAATTPALADVFGSSTTTQPHAPPAPKADILSMYNTNPQQQPVHGMGTGFPAGAAGMRPPGMMPMAGAGMPTYMGARPGMGGANMMQGTSRTNMNMMPGIGGANTMVPGLGGANLNMMQGMGGANMNMMQGMGGANKMPGMGGGMGAIGVPMRPNAPSTQHSAMGASIMAAAHQPGGVFGGAGNTPQKQAPRPASQDKFNDLRW